MDFVFLLEDDTYLHLEFQTEIRIADLDRFLEYDVALYKVKRKSIRTAIVYNQGGDEAVTQLDRGSVQYKAQAICMGRFDGERIYRELQRKVKWQERLDDLDQLNLIFLPLMRGNATPSERAIKAVELAKQVQDESQQTFLIGALIAISDKFIE